MKCFFYIYKELFDPAGVTINISSIGATSKQLHRSDIKTAPSERHQNSSIGATSKQLHRSDITSAPSERHQNSSIGATSHQLHRSDITSAPSERHRISSIGATSHQLHRSDIASAPSKRHHKKTAPRMVMRIDYFIVPLFLNASSCSTY
jgi:hypothetical protein